MKTALALLAVLLAAGCSPSKDDGAGDAPISQALDDGWVILNAPDGYPNVAWRCHKGNGVYVTRGHEGDVRQLQVIPNDPACLA